MILKNYIFSPVIARIEDSLDISCFHEYYNYHRVVVTDVPAHKRTIKYRSRLSADGVIIEKAFNLFLHLPRMHFYTLFSGVQSQNSVAFLFENEYHYSCFPNIDVRGRLNICGLETQIETQTKFTRKSLEDFANSRLSYFFLSEFNNDINLLNPFVSEREKLTYCSPLETSNFMLEWENQTKVGKGLEFIPRVKILHNESEFFLKAKSFIDDFSQK
jgi:hypothetical protein